MNLKLSTLLIILLHCTLIASWAAIAQEDLDQKETPVAVFTVSDQSSILRKMLGTVFSPQTQTLSAQIPGTVVTDRLSIGVRVAKGDVILRLDQREAKANLTLILAELENAKLRIKQRELAYQRAKTTLTKKLSSQAETDNAELALKQAIAEKEAIEARASIAEINIEKHTIRAPFDGVLISDSPVVGRHVLPGDELVKMLDDTNWHLKVYFSNQELSLLKQANASLQLPGMEASQLILTNHSAATIENSGLVEAQFAVIDTKPANALSLPLKSYSSSKTISWLSGQAVPLLLVDTRLSVPQKAKKMDGTGEYVLAVEKGKVVRLNLSDISVGDEVIVMGSNKVNPGDNVSVLPLGNI